jgi:ATP-dependent RNA helicase
MAKRGLLTDDLSHVKFETSENVEVMSTFDSMNLKEDLIRGIYSYGKLLKRNANLLKAIC